MNIHEIWASVLGGLEKETTAITYDVWIKTLEPVDIKDGALILSAPSSEARDFVLNRFRTLIRTVARDVNNAITEVEIIEPSEKKAVEDISEQESVRVIGIEKEAASEVSQAPAIYLNPKYNFDSFVVGKSNQLVHAVAQAVAENPGEAHNPLFIYGGVGLGKTHIMHAVGNAVRFSNPKLKVLYASSEKFANEMIDSFRLGNKANQAFRDKYRLVDVLMIDDIQFFAGKDRTQEEFFHTFNDLYQLNKQIIISSDRPPKELFNMEERLVSRFAWGMIADIQPPDEETRVAILQKKAQGLKQNIKPDILALMAKNPFTNIRDMEGLLNKVIFLAKLSGTDIIEETVHAALKDYQDETSEDSVTAQDIIAATAKYFGITIAEMTGKKKTKDVVEPRQYCIYLISELLAIPLGTIGNYFGGRDHTTIMHSRNKVVEAVRNNTRATTIVADIKSSLYRK
ncbi:MAG: chromosomal replication initiator protein DnaA [Firmicutes bacterium]|nr:chromosomal replication initiator protein DnaA [Bacillota bacterium]